MITILFYLDSNCTLIQLNPALIHAALTFILKNAIDIVFQTRNKQAVAHHTMIGGRVSFDWTAPNQDVGDIVFV